jgi:hypothetical protein
LDWGFEWLIPLTKVFIIETLQRPFIIEKVLQTFSSENAHSAQDRPLSPTELQENKTTILQRTRKYEEV